MNRNKFVSFAFGHLHNSYICAPLVLLVLFGVLGQTVNLCELYFKIAISVCYTLHISGCDTADLGLLSSQ